MTAPSWSWMPRGACRGADLELFFGPDFERQAEREARETRAKAVCAACPVRADCLDWVLGFSVQHGVAGGLGEDERTRLRHNSVRRQRRAAA